jgi:hypothetical protein
MAAGRSLYKNKAPFLGYVVFSIMIGLADAVIVTLLLKL